MSDLIWEDPPPGARRGAPDGFLRKKSPLGLECDALVEVLQDNQGKWARLFDFPSKDEARKRAAFMGRKGLSLYVRETPQGFSLFGRWNGLPEEPEQPSEPQPVDPEPSAPQPEPVRPATF